jgi:uncharacterized membrane protein
LKIKIPNWIIWFIAIVSFLGFLDATYLTVAHYSNSELNCTFLKGCNEVAASKYSSLFGIPLSLLGTFYYLTILFLALIYWDTKNKMPILIIPLITTFGLIFSGYLVFLQIFVIEAICTYCMMSALTSTTLFVLSLFLIRARKGLPIPEV